MSTRHLTVNAKSMDGIVWVFVSIEYNLRLFGKERRVYKTAGGVEAL